MALMDTKKNLPPDANQWAFDRSVEVTLNHLAAARAIAISLNAGHEPNPALVAGLVNAMATNYLAEMTGTKSAPPTKGFNPMATQKLRVDLDDMTNWPALKEISRKVP